MGNCSSTKSTKAKKETNTGDYSANKKTEENKAEVVRKVGIVSRESQMEVKLENLITQSGGSYEERYEKVEEQSVGEGSFGQVFKVRHKTTGLIRAMKVLIKPKESSKNVHFDKECRNEIEILKKIDHPNVVKIYDYFITSTQIQIIMEFCPHGELFKLFNTKKPLSEKQAAFIIYQLLSSVTYCHAVNIIHRDLKPENILITDEKEYISIKVVDFGTAKIVGNNEKMKLFTGSCYYVAPEVLRKNYDGRCDVWSVGVILYMLLTFTPPFTGKSDEDIYKAILKGEFNLDKEPLSDCSPECLNLIKNLLTYDPNKRITAEQALNHEWFILTKVSGLFINDNKKAIQKHLDYIVGLKPISKIQQAVIALIFHQLSETSQVKEIYRIFRVFDVNHDGRITKAEMNEVLMRYFEEEEAKTYTTEVFNRMDNDGNGFVDYEEFARSSIDRSILLDKKHLRSVFDFFDKDGNGEIDFEEIKQIFVIKDVKIDDEVIKNMIKDIDLNGNTEIEYEEFEQMMRNILE